MPEPSKGEELAIIVEDSEQLQRMYITREQQELIEVAEAIEATVEESAEPAAPHEVTEEIVTVEEPVRQHVTKPAVVEKLPAAIKEPPAVSEAAPNPAIIKVAPVREEAIPAVTTPRQPEAIPQPPAIVEVDLAPRSETDSVMQPEQPSNTEHIEEHPEEGADVTGQQPVIEIPDRDYSIETAEHEPIAEDEETMDVFEQLSELIASQQEINANPDIEAGQYAVPETADPVTPETFEEIVLAQPMPESVPDVKTIIAEAEEHPLEETLALISLSLVEAPEDDPDFTEIKEVLYELNELLPATTDTAVAEATMPPRLTPELTQKLLTLLQAVGYHNPREVLLEFVERHNFEFLIQAMSYLYKLRDDENRQELVHRNFGFTILGTAEPLPTRIGKAIMAGLAGRRIIETG